MESHKISITARAARDIAGLDEAVKKRIKECLLDLVKDPRRHSRKLKDAKIGSFRARAGDFRIIFDIDGETIVILRVGHRRDIYR